MKSVDKAVALRKSLPLKAKEPFWAFQGHLRRPRTILATVEKKDVPSAVLFEARRWYIVALCAAYEVHWRQFIRRTLDANPLKRTDLRNLRKHKFSFEDLHSILGNQLTVGELVAAAYVFQGTDVLNQVARDVFDLDLFGGFAKKKFRITVEISEYPKTPPKSRTSTVLTGKKVLGRRPLIDGAFAIRHETVHDTGTRFRPNLKKVTDIESSMLMFNLSLSTYWEGLLETNEEEKITEPGRANDK